MSAENLPSGHRPEREEIALIEVGHTNVAPRAALSLAAAFLVLVAMPGLLEIVGQMSGSADTSAAWPVLQALPAAVTAELDAPAQPLSRQVLAANRAVLAGLHGFEDALEDEAVLARALRPPAQWLLTAWLGVGNERVYKGRNGWLFYRPDVEYLTGGGFLEPDQLARRRASAQEWEVPPAPDPREAILEFHRQLEARGIALIVVPTPVKPSIHPDQLVRDVPAPLENTSYATFVRDLESQGVVVFDTRMALRDSTPSDVPLYLATDTHWQPRAMERVAAALASAIHEHVALPGVAHPGYLWERHPVSQTGDSAAMLDLPEAQRLYPPESVDVRRVIGRDGSPWRPSRDADVLLLGDSFTNIYSLESMGWGTAAGLAEHLSLALGRPVDRIVQNDAGAFATRAQLRRELAAGPRRLAGKRVVLYQFAARELAFGDWQLIDLPGQPAR